MRRVHDHDSRILRGADLLIRALARSGQVRPRRVLFGWIGCRIFGIRAGRGPVERRGLRGVDRLEAIQVITVDEALCFLIKLSGKFVQVPHSVRRVRAGFASSFMSTGMRCASRTQLKACCT